MDRREFLLGLACVPFTPPPDHEPALTKTEIVVLGEDFSAIYSPRTVKGDPLSQSYVAVRWAEGDRMFGVCIVVSTPVSRAQLIEIARTVRARHDFKWDGRS